MGKLRPKPQPAMIGTPPSARVPAKPVEPTQPSRRGPHVTPPEPIPADPAEHAVDFCTRYYEPLEAVTRTRMRQLGIPVDRIGMIDPAFDFRIAAFHPTELDGGGVHPPTGRINLDAGTLYRELLAGKQPPEVSSLWAKERLRHKFDAGIAHEHEEGLGRTHLEAVREAPNTALPITEGARKLLRVIAQAEARKGRQT
jgi:hypothetical protein